MSSIPEQSARSIRVRVLFFGAARDIVGAAELELDLANPSTAETAFAQVLAAFPDLRRFGRSLLFALNQEYAPAQREVRDGDELAVFPPVSGGATDNAIPKQDEAAIPTESVDFFELTTEPLDVGAIARRVVLPQCGATVTLDGYARRWTSGRETLYLIYEAYAPMAVAEMKRLGQEAHRQFEIGHIGIVHRTGRLEIGETSVVIAVSATHRKAAFAACEWAIRELKRTVPIWKKEVFEDGEGWVG
jgi:molybdopterin synthase catalytic subunit